MSPQAQAQIRELINDLSSAWMNADNRRFADIWHFNALKGLPGKKEWLTRLAQQRGLWRKWDIQIAEVRKMNSIAVWLTSHSCSMIRAADTLDVKAELRVESARSGKNWTGKTDISIKQERGRYRIIYWHCPFEEILAATSPERGAT